MSLHGHGWGGLTAPVPIVVQFSTRKEGVLPLWDCCVEVPNVYTCPVERFLQVLSAQYAAPISERHPGLADAGEQAPWGESCQPHSVIMSGGPAPLQGGSHSCCMPQSWPFPAVCVKLVEDVLNRRLPRRPGSAQGEQVTIFQFWSHFESLSALVLDTYMMELAEEGECPPALLRPWHVVPEHHHGGSSCSTAMTILGCHPEARPFLGWASRSDPVHSLLPCCFPKHPGSLLGWSLVPQAQPRMPRSSGVPVAPWSLVHLGLAAPAAPYVATLCGVTSARGGCRVPRDGSLAAAGVLGQRRQAPCTLAQLVVACSAAGTEPQL